MTPEVIAFVIAGYFLVLVGISWLTSRKATNESFFLGERKSPWYIVAFGMIGASLSGVTFISVPGWTGAGNFGYMQVVLGYFVGYFVVAFVLLPIYYRMNLTSIYEYLKNRFGTEAYKMGAFYFILSRVLGASFRLFLVAIVLQQFVFDDMGVGFPITVGVSILLIWLYTNRGGIKTIIWTDTLQTLFMLVAAGLAIYLIQEELVVALDRYGLKTPSVDLGRIFEMGDPMEKNYFWKQFLGGMFVTITMTGLDQDMMQKNLSCKNLKDAQKNMISMSTILVVVNFFFVLLGLLLYNYWSYLQFSGAEFDSSVLYHEDGSYRSDMLFPAVAMNGKLGIAMGVTFILGLVAAAYSSADSALTSLTTSFCVDFVDIDRKEKKDQERIRKIVHVGTSLVLFGVIILFKYILTQNVIDAVLTAAGYTYGPLLGLFAFGILTKRSVAGKYIPVVVLLSPLLTYGLAWLGEQGYLGGYILGYELLVFNGLLTFAGLWLFSESGGELPPGIRSQRSDQ